MLKRLLESYATLESKDHIVNMNHQDVSNCLRTSKSFLCLKRVCKMRRLFSNIKSCIVSTNHGYEGGDTVEVVFDPEHFKPPIDTAEKIEVFCENSVHVLWADKEIVQFNLPKSCDARSKMFEVDRVVTSLHETRNIQDNELRIKVFHLNETDSRNFTIDSEGTYQIIQQIAASRETDLAISKISENIKVAEDIKAESIKHREEFDDKVSVIHESTNLKMIIMGAVGFGLLVLSLGVTCMCFWNANKQLMVIKD